MYCITHEMQGFFESRDMNGEECIWVSCPPPELEEDWELSLDVPSPEELKRMDSFAEEIKMSKVRRFRFLGYGNRQPYREEFGDSYLEMPKDKYYWYSSPVLTVGKVYDVVKINCDWAEGFSPEITVVDDEGDEMQQELQFFEEVFE